jgi:hypothetical protein
MAMTRKEFLSTLGKVAAAAAAAAALVACGGDDSSPPPDAAGGNPDAPLGGPDAPPAPDAVPDAAPPPDAGPSGNCLANGTSDVIGGNHGHELTVAKADVAAGVDKTYDITGTALHSHAVTITAAMFAQLQANFGVMTVSTIGAGHTHNITVTCV